MLKNVGGFVIKSRSHKPSVVFTEMAENDIWKRKEEENKLTASCKTHNFKLSIKSNCFSFNSMLFKTSHY